MNEEIKYFNYPYDNQSEICEKIINFLNEFQNIDGMVDSQEAYESYGFLRFLIYSVNTNLPEILNVIEKNNGYELICKILVSLEPKCEELDFESVRPIEYWFSYNETNLNERKINFLLLSFCIINKMVPGSLDFRKHLIENDGLKSFLNLLNNHKFIEKLSKFEPAFIGNIIYDVNFLSKIADSNKNIWNELNAVGILIDYLNKFSKSKFFVFMILANIASDKDIENLPEINQVIDKTSVMVTECLNNCSDNYTLQEFINEEDKTKYEFKVRYIQDKTDNVTVSITGLILTLYRLSVNNKIKWVLYQKPGLKESLKKLIYDGNDVEKQYSLELITQLCFEDKVLEDMRQDTEFYKYIEQLKATENIVYKKLYKTCEQFLWIFKSKQIDSLNLDEDKHIMISYNSASRELCLKIKKCLEDSSYKVWIDVDEIHGSSLDSMAKAVEGAQCVLICVTEKYRQSVNCQSEAQYAFRLNKPIIPLIMQKGYASVDGWLGFIIGDKIFIDFTKYELDECFKRLKNQLLKITSKMTNSKSSNTFVAEKPSITFSTAPNDSSSQNQSRLSNKIEEWNDGLVKKWFDEKGFIEFWEYLKPINGKNLFQLYQLQTHTPEFFYKSLTKDDKVNLKSVILFSSCLKELFEDSN